MSKTITEALAEIKLINKKLEKKKDTVLRNLTRLEHLPDPLESSGGAQKVIKEELQAIEDLEARITTLRSSIAKANLENQITVNGETKTIYEWLTWKREVAGLKGTFCRQVSSTMERATETNTQRPTVFNDKDGNTLISKLIYNTDYRQALDTEQKVSDIMEQLDGQLSLKNATIKIS